MLCTLEHSDDVVRLYFGRSASIVSYFTPRADCEGSDLHIEPGFHTYPWDFAAQKDAVRHAVLADAARRLNVDIDQVLSLPFFELQLIADPELPAHYRWATRRRSRTKTR